MVGAGRVGKSVPGRRGHQGEDRRRRLHFSIVFWR